MTTHQSLFALYAKRTGKTTYELPAPTDTGKLSQFFRDRIDTRSSDERRCI